jgi:uncharacterized protein (DUF488 family)
VSGPLFTVGHSDRTIEAFLDLLTAAGVVSLVDVRKLPGSRSNPQFDADALTPSLEQAGIRYRHEPALGGRRPMSKTVPPDINALWRNRSFHNSADHALGSEFAHALERLREEGAQHATAVMCSEAVWWRCHRRIFADHVLARGDDVVHIMAGRRVAPATLTPGALVHPDGVVSYPLPG